MDLLKTNFQILEVRGCPMYKADEYFSVSGLALLPPDGKPACLFLSKGLADILLQYLSSKKKGPEALKDEYNCPGCTGIIKFGPIDESGGLYLTPQMRMLAAAEKKEMALESGSLVDMLGTFSFFSALEPAHLKEIVEYFKQDTIPAGKIVLQKGRPGKFLYVIMSGSVHVLDDDGSPIANLQRGEIFGEMSLISGKPVSAPIRTAETTRVLMLSGRDLSNILVKYPFLQMAFTRMLVQRLSLANAARTEEYAAGVSGQLDEVNPGELFQMFNENRKTGVFELRLPLGKGLITFSDGVIIRAEYAGKKGKEAFWAILREHTGSFKFTSCLPLEDMGAESIGNFMGLLMEGMRLIDEENASAEQLAEK
ncbi:MAG: cyclic nucleotide-binding domain-containing protein [Proteobacteria bacterium]|nr:cyclic nucleotide-binding domain-containing protein [Pseudomonadota bacterium]MBU1640331.1 cyclic nucleotide-binding domain-containing protein [Pseudomonadota bacterium]